MLQNISAQTKSNFQPVYTNVLALLHSFTYIHWDSQCTDFFQIMFQLQKMCFIYVQTNNISEQNLSFHTSNRNIMSLYNISEWVVSGDKPQLRREEGMLRLLYNASHSDHIIPATKEFQRTICTAQQLDTILRHHADYALLSCTVISKSATRTKAELCWKNRVVFVMVNHKTVNKGIPNNTTPASGL